MTDLLFFGLFFAAIAIGWVLGRRSRIPEITNKYFAGQRETGKTSTDTTLDALVEGLVPDSGNIQTRIALGVQLRRRGEVDGAVRIHQELLSRNTLAAPDQAQAQLELARDYISAGLLDRAEELLLELVRDFPEQAAAGRRHLLEIYETERDWHRAMDTGKALLPRRLVRDSAASDSHSARGQRIAQRLAHYACELAEEARVAGDIDTARRYLEEALARDNRSVRASMLLAQLEHDAGRYQLAAQVLRRVQLQDPDYLPEIVELLRKCYGELGETAALREYLLQCLESRPTAALVTVVADDIARNEGARPAIEFLAEQLREYPSLNGLSQLIDLQHNGAGGGTGADLELLQSLTRRLMGSRPSYRCGHCGFAGKYLHWHCPGCKRWGSIKAIEDAL